MAQNATVTLTESQTMRRAHALDTLRPMVGRVAGITCETRSGEARFYAGEIVEVLEGATPDKACVRILTEQGFKSANLHLVYGVRDACHACHKVLTDHDEDACHTMAQEVAHKRATVGW